jgi:hypothetical protein
MTPFGVQLATPFFDSTTVAGGPAKNSTIASATGEVGSPPLTEMVQSRVKVPDGDSQPVIHKAQEARPDIAIIAESIHVRLQGLLGV